MTGDGAASEPPLSASTRSADDGSCVESLREVEGRLANAKRELRMELIRIAQLQYDLQLLMVVVQRPFEPSTPAGTDRREAGGPTRQDNVGSSSASAAHE